MKLTQKYELFNFLQPGEKYINGHEMLKRAGDNLGTQENLDYFLSHQEEVPEEWKKYWIVFGNVRHPDNPEDVTYVYWRGDRWVERWCWLGLGVWDGGYRVLRRKSLGDLETGALEISNSEICPHTLKHTERLRGVAPEGIPKDVTNWVIEQFCADCGLLLKSVTIRDKK